MRLNFGASRTLPQWRRSMYCANNDCVEIAWDNGTVMLRNSTKPRKVVRYTPEEWRVFTRALQAVNFSDVE
jgi:hypothetical protein